MATAAARKAWNEAMKATAGTAALPPALAGRPMKRRSDRHKKGGRNTQRKKRKTSAVGGDTSLDDDYAMEVWIDALEGVDASSSFLGTDLTEDKADDDDDAFDELEDLEEGGKKKGANRRKKKRKAGGGNTATVAMPKRFLPRMLASILTEEHGRVDSTAQAFLESHAVLVSRSSTSTHQEPQQQPPPPLRKVALPRLLPRRPYCPVTGLPGIYKDPSTGGTPYATLSALAQIRERPPPWQTLSGAAAFAEAQRSILDE
jgi:hypothetical protein